MSAPIEIIYIQSKISVIVKGSNKLFHMPSNGIVIIDYVTISLWHYVLSGKIMKGEFLVSEAMESKNSYY